MKVELAPGSSLRQLAAEHLGDADLWPEIVRASGLSSAAEARAGMVLRVPRTEVSTAAQALESAAEAIQKANEIGARVFAQAQIGEAVDKRRLALIERRHGRWQQCRELATAAATAAEKAFRQTAVHRDAQAEALLSLAEGTVQSRKPAGLVWERRSAGTSLVEAEKVRTLSSSAAELLFLDESRVRLGPSSQAVIQSLRVDQLSRRQKASVSLEEGDVFALLGGSGARQALDVSAPGVTTDSRSNDFWISRRESVTKVANFDRRGMQVTSAGTTVRLAANQGTLVRHGFSPSDARQLLTAPELMGPDHDTIVSADELTLSWQRLHGAVSYRVEISLDPSFDRPVMVETEVRGPGLEVVDALRQAGHEEGIFFWRVSGTDALGFPGARSLTRRFQIQLSRVGPFLSIISPRGGAIVDGSRVVVTGIAAPESSLRLNGEPVRIADDGAFSGSLALGLGVNHARLALKGNDGSETERTITIHRVADGPPPIDLELAEAHQEALIESVREAYVLRGRTDPGAAVELVMLRDSGAETQIAAARASSTGDFALTVPVKRQARELVIRSRSLTGRAAERQIRVVRLRGGPSLEITRAPQSLIGSRRVEIAGRVGAGAQVWINGRQARVVDGEFVSELDLQPGANQIMAVARDEAGREMSWQRSVYCDLQGPRLVGSSVKIAQRGDRRVLEIEVRAADDSELRRLASVELRSDGWSGTYTLTLDDTRATYRGSIILPPALSRPAHAHLVMLADHAGNRRTHQLVPSQT